MIDTCEKCGKEISVGDWFACPHGKPSFTNIPDDVPGGFVVENGFSEPTRFYSHSAHRAALAAKGMEIQAKWAGPQDKHLTRWDSVDWQGAAMLVSRGSRVKAAPAEERIPITTSDPGTTFKYRVDR